MKKRLLCLTLVFAIIFAMVPFASLKVNATDTVDTIIIRIATPETGNGPSYTLASNGTNLNSDYVQAEGSAFNQDSTITYKGVTWYDGLQPMSRLDGEYQIGHSYSVTIIVEAPSGKEFKYIDAQTPDVTATVNGFNATVSKVDGYAPYAYLKISYTFIPDHAHISKGREITEEPTCTKQGQWEERCAICNTLIEWGFIPALGHDYSETIITPPTCTEDGLASYTCSRCGDTYQDVVSALGHKYKEVTTKATLTKNGLIEEKCSVCGDVCSYITIFHPQKYKLSKTTYTYNGKAQKPSITIKDCEGYTIKSSNYTVTYANKSSKKVGTYKLKVTFKGNYSGSKNFTYTIIPKGTSISSLTKGKKSFTVKWGKQTSETTGYQIEYATSSKFNSSKKVTVSSNKTTSKTVSKLKSKKTYYVRIRTYKTVSGKKIYSGWSKVKSVKTK